MSFRDVQRAAKAKPFARLSADHSEQECMIYVAWSGLGDPGDDGSGHLRMRARVTADLGLGRVPDPPFTSDEMQTITHAAKMEALRCLRRRKARRGG